MNSTDSMNTADRIEAFFAQYSLKKAKKGAILMYPDDDPPGAVYLVSGQIRQYDITSKGNEVVVNVFKEHAVLPLTWIVNQAPNHFFYEAFTDIAYKQAPRSNVADFIKDTDGVAHMLLGRLLSGIDGYQQRLAHLMGGSGYGRVVCELLIECKRFGSKQNDGTYTLSLREEELANRAGLSRETVSRELAKLKKAGLLHVSHGGIVIKDMSELEKRLAAAL